MTEAHEKADAPWMSVLFFAGFIDAVTLDGVLSGGWAIVSVST